jgi:hypothetical protein
MSCNIFSCISSLVAGSMHRSFEATNSPKMLLSSSSSPAARITISANCPSFTLLSAAVDRRRLRAVAEVRETAFFSLVAASSSS